MGKNVGYVRVSTGGQNVGRQLAGVELDKVFTDRCSETWLCTEPLVTWLRS